MSKEPKMQEKDWDDEDDVFDDEDDAPDGDPDYYYCTCCGFSTIVYYGGWGCPRCTAIMEPEYY